MVININPNRINVRTPTPGKSGDNKREADVSVYTTPKRSDVNFIPAPESLRTLVSNAVAALRKGVYWDRGTIQNLLV